MLFNVYTEATVTEGRCYQIKAATAEEAKIKLEVARFNLKYEVFDSFENNDERITDAEAAE